MTTLDRPLPMFAHWHLASSEPYRHPASQRIEIMADITPALNQPEQQMIVGDQPDNGPQRQQKLALRVMKVGRYTNHLAFTWVDATGTIHHYFGPVPLEPGKQMVGARMDYVIGECFIYQGGEWHPAHDPTPLAPINTHSNPLYIGSNGNRSFVFRGAIHSLEVLDAGARRLMHGFTSASPQKDFVTGTRWIVCGGA